MAHNITVRKDGTAEAAFALHPAWHGLGTVFDHPMTSVEALAAAHLDWKVVQWKMGYAMPTIVNTADGIVMSERFNAVDLLANVRSDNGTFLGAVSPTYKMVQNQEAFAFLDALIEEHQMQYESAFSLLGGKRVCLLGRLPQVDTVKDDDKLLRYVLLSIGHDGTGGIRFGPTSVRVVCANTYAVALKQGTTEELSIGHTGDIAGKLESARKILQQANERFNEYAQQSAALAAHRMTTEEWTAYLDLLCPQLDPRDPDWTEARADKINLTRRNIRACYANDRQTGNGVGGTAWAAFNAVTEHIDHLPRRGATVRQKAEARFNVCLYGAGRDMKRRAFEAACRFAGIGENAA